MRSLLLLSATLCLAVAAEPAFVASGAWKAAPIDGKPGFVLDYEGTGFPGLLAELAVEADSFYAFEFQTRNSLGALDSTPQVRIKAELEYPWEIRTGSAWGSHRLYFHSGNATTAKVRIFLNPGEKRRLEVIGPKLTKLTTKDLQTNLLPEGDLEKAAPQLCAWSIRSVIKDFTASVIPNEGYMSGERSLRLERKQADESEPLIASIGLPVNPGADVELTFWAKAKAETMLVAGVNCWFAPHTGGHFHKHDKLKVGTEWKQYSVKAKAPTDLAAFPDLKARLLQVRFTLPKDQASTVLIDDISFVNSK